MKKGTSFFYILISIISLTLCACKLDLEDTDLMDAPEASTANNQVSIIIPRLNNDIKYINVFRKDSAKSNIESIGIVFSKALMDIMNQSGLMKFRQKTKTLQKMSL